jgi:hypothetical protein
MFLNLLIAKLEWKIGVKDNSSVSLLLKDRPEIAEVLKGHDALKHWLVEQVFRQSNGISYSMGYRGARNQRYGGT